MPPTDGLETIEWRYDKEKTVNHIAKFAM